ncbi:MAG: AmmeMemoRadiSam system protein B [Burkholderiaceae bacterium]|nr:AmmeMemoRadiSam system protein B [Burkholderiaceae bacterium]
MLQVRPPAVAGLFYPAEQAALRAQVTGLLAAATPAAGRPKMLIAPHAGYVYSGPTAAHAYALLAPYRDEIRRVVLLGPAHRVWVDGVAVPSAQRFATPLGEVPLDHETLARLRTLPDVIESDRAHAAEHALEVQLPFLQTVLADFVLVPLAVGDMASERLAALLQDLWGGDETLIVISSDLSHYHPYRQAQSLDRQTVARILALQEGLHPEQACGATAINAAILAARVAGLRPRLLDLRNSGDTAGDRGRVVGYCAVAFEPDAHGCRL